MSLRQLEDSMDDYLRLRRSLGFVLKDTEEILRSYLRFLDENHLSELSLDSALAWSSQPAGVHPVWQASRLSVLRVFTQHLHAQDPGTVVIPAHIVPGPTSLRAEPFIYSDQDLTTILNAAGTLEPSLRAATYRTLISLLAVTGIRVGELIGLNDDDLDQSAATITIQDGKPGARRILPVHISVRDALCAYVRERDADLARYRKQTKALFRSIRGTRLLYANVQRTFHQLIQQAGLIPRSDRCRPRLHDLRHTFATSTLARWQHDGEDTAVLLPVLAAYLGHASISSTYWYLSSTPELMAAVVERLEDTHDGRTS